jgi:hypothetical protein
VLDYFLLRKVMRAGVEADLACSLLLACEKGMGAGGGECGHYAEMIREAIFRDNNQ